jgi:hypothetical protein
MLEQLQDFHKIPPSKQFIKVAYQVETSPHVETMQTPISTTGSRSDG